MGILFAILSPAIFGVNNYIDKFLLSKNNISPVVITIYGGLAGFFVGILLLLINGFYPISATSLIIILASGFLTTTYLLPYYKALNLDEASYVVPLFQFYPVFVLLLSLIFFDEKFTLIQYFGCFILIFAGFLISIEKLSKQTLRLRKSFMFMVISSFMFAFAQILYKFGLEEIPFIHTLPYEGFGIFLGAIMVASYKNNFKQFKSETSKFKKRVFVYLSINEFVYLFARYTGYFAISLISVGIVSVISGLQPLFVLVYGIILSIWFPKILKEVINKKVLFQKTVSIFLMLIGFIFIFI